MTRPISRRTFLSGATIAGTSFLINHRSLAQDSEKQPRLDLDLVGECVRVAHGGLAAVTELVTATPALANACHDWGGGDFETPLGAASHTGQQEIARFLLAHGARMDIFCATMLGEIEIVKAFVAFDPAAIRLKGPHGLSLLHHANKGQDQEMIRLLDSLGAE